MEPHCKDGTQKKLQEDPFLTFGFILPYSPLHAGIESAKSHIEAK